jgi:hypothetical protein
LEKMENRLPPTVPIFCGDQSIHQIPTRAQAAGDAFPLFPFHSIYLVFGRYFSDQSNATEEERDGPFGPSTLLMLSVAVSIYEFGTIQHVFSVQAAGFCGCFAPLFGRFLIKLIRNGLLVVRSRQQFSDQSGNLYLYDAPQLNSIRT